MSTVTLDGSGSSDPDGDALTYRWTLERRPDNSATFLTSNLGVRPTFVPDAQGEYEFSLVVADSQGPSTNAARVVITVAGGNQAPIANAGQSRSVLIQRNVTLDGVQSTDANRDRLTYSWTLTTRPAGSNATLTDATTALASFKPDLPGPYVATLVVNDGTTNSAPHSITLLARAGVSAGDNAEPFALIGPQVPTGGGRERQVLLGDTVRFAAGASLDPEGLPLNYNWSFAERPASSSNGAGSVFGSTSTAVSTNAFIPDVVGTFRPQLSVFDGRNNSPQSVANIRVLAATGENAVPWAVAGPYQTGVAGIGEAITFNGSSSSDANPNTSLDYHWMLVSRPLTSTASLANFRTVQPSLTPDVPGVYVASLVASDGKVGSLPDSVALVAVPASGPLNGRWVGTTGQDGRSISFDIVNNRLSSFSFHWTSLQCGANSTPNVPTVTTFGPPLIAYFSFIDYQQEVPVEGLAQFNIVFNSTVSPPTATGTLVYKVTRGACVDRIVTTVSLVKQ